MDQAIRQAPAPSTAAASYSSAGMVRRAAYRMIML
jgi:tRNA U34 5-methylaminomethyl-2-thiouridine-forming methyltransferase MnmC